MVNYGFFFLPRISKLFCVSDEVSGTRMVRTGLVDPQLKELAALFQGLPVPRNQDFPVIVTRRPAQSHWHGG